MIRKRVAKGFGFFGIESIEDEIMGISETGCVLLIGGDADTEPRESLRPEMFDQVFDAVVSCSRRIVRDLEFPERKIEFVLDDEDISGRELVEIQDFARGNAGKIHEGLWFDEHDFPSVYHTFGDFRFEFLLKREYGKLELVPKFVEYGESYIVTRAVVLASWIAQTENDFHSGTVVMIDR